MIIICRDWRYLMYSVVIIEDDEWVLRGIQKSFNWEKYDFYVKDTFYDAEPFLKYLDGHHVDVVITDIKMPRMSGLELINKVKFELKIENIYFVIVSAFDSYEYMREAINLGVVDYCKKPIVREETEQILQKLHNILSGESTDGQEVINNSDFEDLLYYINTHYMEKLTLNQLAKKYYFNSNYLCLLFKKKLGMAFSAYLLKIRMEKAKELLEEHKYSITEIATKVGYSEYSYFNKSFKKYYSLPPSEFKKTSKHDA